MEKILWRREYKDNDSFHYCLASDLHIDDAGFDQDLFQRDMDRALSMGARIWLNGDVMGLILPGDLKRYVRGSDPGDLDDKIGAAVERAEKVLLPYVDHIDMIGTGNHETAVLKHHSVDATKMLIGFLNRARRPDLPKIRHGGYTGFIRISFDNPARKRTYAYDVFYNHGQGGSSDVTSGTIDLNRRQNVSADLIWMGHKHKKLSMMLPSEIGISNDGRLYEREVRGVMTGTYLRNVHETCADRDGYRLSYGEERMRTPQGRGCAFLRLDATRDGIRATVET